MATLEKFSLKSLSTIDGERIALAFEQALRRVVQDCEDRPGEKKERTVSLTLAVKPVLDSDGVCDDCNIQVLVSDNVPKRKSKVVVEDQMSAFSDRHVWTLTRTNSITCAILFTGERLRS